MEASKKYRNGQDHIAAFIADKIRRNENTKNPIKKTSLLNEFKEWFQQEQGTKKMPKGEELYEYMNKRFGTCSKKGWNGVEIIQDDEEEDDAINTI